MNADVAIIGGGLAGIACAIGLTGSGLKVVLIEASEALGGRARSWIDEHTGDTVDLGPHVITNEHRNMRRLLSLLGTERNIVWHTDNFLILADREPVVMKRYPLPAPLSLLPTLFTVRGLSLRDLASNTPVVMHAMGIDDAEIIRLDALSAEEYLQSKGVTRPFVDWFWRSAAMTFMNVPLDQCSAGALMRVFSRLLGDNRFRFGFAPEGVADLFVPAATRTIQSSGGTIITARTVVGIDHDNNQLSGVVLDDGTRLRTRYCVATVPPQDLCRILPAAWMSESRGLRDLSAFRPVPYISTYLWFDRKLTTEQMWVRLWSPDTLNYDFYDLSNIRPGWRQQPSVIAGNIIDSRRAQHLSDEQVIRETVRELSEFTVHARAATVLHARVHRVPMAIAAPVPGLETRRPDTRTAIPGLLLAGDWTNTHLPFSMESAVRSGFLAAEALWNDMGKPRRLALSMEPPTGIARLVGWAKHHR